MGYCKPCLMFHEGNCAVAKVKEFVRLLFGFYRANREYSHAPGRIRAIRCAWRTTLTTMAYDPDEYPARVRTRFTINGKGNT